MHTGINFDLAKLCGFFLALNYWVFNQMVTSNDMVNVCQSTGHLLGMLEFLNLSCKIAMINEHDGPIYVGVNTWIKSYPFLPRRKKSDTRVDPAYTWPSWSCSKTSMTLAFGTQYR